MRLRKLLCLVLAAIVLLPTLSLTTARADEGMWTFDNVPKAEIRKRYGFNITDDWLKHVQLSSVRFNNGGSGSFVSPDGLVMTNHHIAEETLSKISDEKKDYLKDGFYARNQSEEAKDPDLELNVLQSIEDVTARVNAAVTSGMNAAQAQAARTAAINAISEESKKATGLRSDVVTLYQGGQYHLYRYKTYDDVRLVFAPEETVGFFGGDPDNFEWPRYCLDLALFRVYENDQPVKSGHYLKWSKNGAQAGELVFTSGHPGTTNRLNTYAHLEYFRDFGFPFLLKFLERYHKLLADYSAKGEEQRRQARDEVLSIENSIKARRGGLQGLQNKAVMAQKLKDEKVLRKKLSTSAKKHYDTDPWDAVAKARKALLSIEVGRRMLEVGWAFNTTYFNTARSIVRMATESTKENKDRLPEYTDARIKSLKASLTASVPIYDDFELAKLTDGLLFLRDEMGATNGIVQKILMNKTPQERARSLIGGTKLKDIKFRKQLIEGGMKAVEESEDPMIILARSIDSEARSIRKRYEDEVIGVEREAYAKIAKAKFELYGTSVYPDATFTLRLSYGAVKGYTSKGNKYKPFTDFAGLYRHSAEHNNQEPFKLAESWERRKEKLNLKVPFDFITTNDIVGGNSGSPIINSKAEIVGLAFDGNIESLLGDFIYDGTVNRTIGVDSRGMIEALRKIYGMDYLADEITKN
jgi:hypothetical protein